MPPILLLSTFLDVWNYSAPFLAAILALLTGWGLSTLTFRREQLSKHSDEMATEQKTWRDGRLAAEKTNSEAIVKEHAERIFWQLENAADWERVVSILKEFGEVQRQLAVVANTSAHHSTEIQRLNQRVEEAGKHLNEFILRHVKTAS